jgi:hypothetical protein
MYRLLLSAIVLVLVGCAADAARHATPLSPTPTPVAQAPCSPEAIARDMRLLSAFFFWTREGARNRLNACQGHALTATPLPPRAPTYRCTESCIGYAPCTTTCRPGF